MTKIKGMVKNITIDAINIITRRIITNDAFIESIMGIRRNRKAKNKPMLKNQIFLTK